MQNFIEPNLLLVSDSYKTSHYLQYPPGTNGMFSYIEARKKDDFTVFFGLQAILLNYLTTRIDEEMIRHAGGILGAHGVPFNEDGWRGILTRYKGALPIRIRAVPEGSVVPTGNVLVTVEPTDPDFPWAASYFESLLLRVWYPTTVATKSFKIKRIIRDALLRTADDLSGLPFKLHDFGARGASSGETAIMGGMGHLVNFYGTDTLEALHAAYELYDATPRAGFSIPAAEHSTITSWGREGEVDAYRNMIRRFGLPGAVFAVVSDSYDIYNACEHLWGEALRQEVIDSGATLVVRPDSGEPAAMVLKCCEMLGAKFGHKINSKGFKVLNTVRVIQGDGLNGPDDILNILLTLESHGWSADNIAFGMGGGLLQQCNRDDYGFAMKCSAIKVGDEWRDVYKDPITAPGKKSKRGRLELIQDDGRIMTVTEQQAREWGDKKVSLLRTVYENGAFQNTVTLDEIRAATGLGW